MNTISFMSANYVARQLGYHMTEGWGQGDAATTAYFRPLETFGTRFEEILRDISGLGFSAVDLWGPHIHPAWATPEHLQIAQALLKQYHLSVNSLATWYGSTSEEVERLCLHANALGTSIVGGNIPLWETDRATTIQILKKHKVRLGVENHPEKNAGEIIARIGDGQGQVGACVDTGWFGTYAYDAATALEELAPYLVHIHLKDVRAPGAHETCRLGEGCVGIEKCVQTLKRIRYEGPISIEHEPSLFDPTEDIRASYVRLRHWLE